MPLSPMPSEKEDRAGSRICFPPASGTLRSDVIPTPFDDLRACAQVLSNTHLRELRVKVLLAVERLVYDDQKYRYDWMWDGFVDALAWFGVELCDEWKLRGNGDNCRWQILDRVGELLGIPEMPAWWGDPDVHLSHRAFLLRDDPRHYRPIFPTVNEEVPLLWP